MSCWTRFERWEESNFFLKEKVTKKNFNSLWLLGCQPGWSDGNAENLLWK